MNRRRLDIEVWRDAMLAVSGKLDRDAGRPDRSTWPTPSNLRRTVYAKISRHDLNHLLRLFDFPDANITSERRTEDHGAAAAAVRPQQPLRGRHGQGVGARRDSKGSGQSDAAGRSACSCWPLAGPLSRRNCGSPCAFLAASDAAGGAIGQSPDALGAIRPGAARQQRVFLHRLNRGPTARYSEPLGISAMNNARVRSTSPWGLWRSERC